MLGITIRVTRRRQFFQQYWSDAKYYKYGYSRDRKCQYRLPNGASNARETRRHMFGVVRRHCYHKQSRDCSEYGADHGGSN